MSRPYTGAELDAMMVEIEAQAEPPRRPYKRRIGARQLAVALHVSLEPGLSMRGLAAILAPGKPTWQTFAAIHRAIDAGLVVGVRKGRSLRLYPQATEQANNGKGFVHSLNPVGGSAPVFVPDDLSLG